MTQAPVQSADQRTSLTRQYLLLATLVAFVLSLVLTVFVVQGDEQEARHAQFRDHSPLTNLNNRGEHEVHTHFGVLGTHRPSLITGISAKALASQNHGIQDYVPPSHELIQVPITLFNDLNQTVRYNPRWFQLVSRKHGSLTDSKPGKLASSSFEVARLQPRAAIEGNISFVMPRTGGDLFLLLNEPGHPTIRVPLGTSGAVYAPQAGDTVSHGGATHDHQGE